MRIGRAGGALNERGDVHPDLAERLTIEATKAARHFLGICIRAIDYLPPLDVEFGEFLRAVVTVDSDTVPEDPWGYRAELVKAFRLRGIVPRGVISYSEDALRWGGPATALPPCEGLDFHRLGADIGAIDPRVGLKETLRTQPTNAAKQQAQFLYRYAMDNTAALRLSTAADAKLYVNGFHPIYRIGPNGRLHIEGIAQFMQKRNVDAGPDAPGETMPARGGSTVIFASDGTVKYVIHKSVDSAERIARRREYRHQINAAAPYLIEALAAGINFSALHRGV